ncbi:MAG: phospholipase D family protein [Candidatus Methanoperedens sp.]|nr:phospholipase D family protein [Candidatus Methanoperedens sp.]
MAEFLTTSGISYKLEELIKNSKDKLYLISPYLQIADSLRQRIKEKDLPSVTIKVVYRKDNKINADELSFLQELKNCKVYCFENLHAKCYLNENTAIITSMNLYDFSQRNNREMGIKIDKETDSKLYEDIYNEVTAIINTSEEPPFAIRKMEKEIPVIPSGFCIRCGANLKINLEKPLCFNCYGSWEKYSNPQFQENFCHICGKESATTYEKPVCYTCYKKVNK